MDYDNYTVGGDVYAELKLKKIEIDATFNITYTDAFINSKNSTHIRVRILHITYLLFLLSTYLHIV